LKIRTEHSWKKKSGKESNSKEEETGRGKSTWGEGQGMIERPQPDLGGKDFKKSKPNSEGRKK